VQLQPAANDQTMDILKLLSRSTKQTNKRHTGKDAASAKLPSAGKSANPQLYNDEVPESRGQKRKRVVEETNEQDPGKEYGQVEEGLDFFAPKSAKPKSKRHASNDAKPAPEPPHRVTPSPPRLLDEDECKRILRSHRLKLTLLSSQSHAKGNKNPQKSSKKSERKMDETRPLYPQPLVAYDDLRATYKIHGRMGENLAQQGYTIPTEVQMGSLPLLLNTVTALGSIATDLGISEGSHAVDLLAVAPTGSGKTLAFIIPVVNTIVQRRRTSSNKRAHVLEAIIVAPTKELANQITNEAKKLSIGTGVKVVGMRKGMRVAGEQDSGQSDASSDDDEISETEDNLNGDSLQPLVKADILVTTPGLLLSALSTSSKSERLPLPTVRTFVLDEADVLLDPLFRDQTLGIWNSCTNPGLRVTLWSATMGSNIETLALKTIQSRKVDLELDSASIVVRLIVGLKDSAIPNITHRLTYAANEPGKLIALRQLLRPTAKSIDATQSLRPPFLVFTQTIPRAVALHSELKYDIPAEAGGSSRIEVLHSDLSDSDRDHVMTRFRNGEIWVLITTDILSRGIDFRGINGVVNYDIPNSGASYIHRVGRTGRAGRDGGVAVTFYTKEDIPYVKNVANIIAASEKQAGKPAGEKIQKWLLNALPNPSKDEKKKLKMHGVEARRGGLGKGNRDNGTRKAGKGKVLISTKSGYERKLENNRRGAIEGSKRRTLSEQGLGDNLGAEESEWDGIDD
jgi:ATP-dependent RNA helicase DDX52/ROK1